MTEQLKTLAELKEDADGLGIEYKENWGAKKLKAAIEAELGKLSESDDEPTVNDGDEPAPAEKPSLEPEDEPDADDGTDDEPEIEAGTDSVRLLNVGIRAHMVAGHKLLPGESAALTEKQLNDEHLMAKIKTSIRCGVLEEVK